MRSRNEANEYVYEEGMDVVVETLMRHRREAMILEVLLDIRETMEEQRDLLKGIPTNSFVKILGERILNTLKDILRAIRGY